MIKNTRELLLQYFPLRERLSYSDFVYDGEIEKYFNNDLEILRRCYEAISHPWPEISLLILDEIDSWYDYMGINGTLIIRKLNQKSFIHVFPAFLVEATAPSYVSDRGGMGNFVNNCLNLTNVKKGWQQAYYASLGHEVSVLVNYCLRMNCCNEGFWSLK
jgi:hypothetical protein